MLHITAYIGLLALTSGFITGAPYPTVQTIQWVDCKTAIPDTLVQANLTLPDSLPETLKCGRLVVPLDYSRKLSPTNNITLGFAMHRPQNPAGLINLNPGGPGVEAASYAWALALEDPDSSLLGLGGFDVLAMDTRGTHSSTPINRTYGDYVIPSHIPSTQEEFDTYHNDVAQVVQGCIDNSPPRLLEFMSSEETIRDWDSIRQALGYKKMSILGESYGTFSAPLYATKFPENVDKLVLDAVFPHTLPLTDLIPWHMKTLNNLLARSDAFCLNDTTCPFHDEGKGAVQKAFQRAVSLAESGKADNNTASDIRAAVYNAFLTGHPNFAGLNGALAFAIGQNNWTALTYDNFALLLTASLFPSMPTLCLDLQIGNSSTFQGYQALIEAAKSVDVNDMQYGHDLSIVAVCGAWPFKGKSDCTIKTNAQTMFITTDFDLNTPIESTFFQREQIPNSSLVVRHGGGHVSFDVPGPVREIGSAFLANGTVPDAADNALYSVYPAGTENGPVKDLYEVPVGEVAGDLSEQ